MSSQYPYGSFQPTRPSNQTPPSRIAQTQTHRVQQVPPPEQATPPSSTASLPATAPSAPFSDLPPSPPARKPGNYSSRNSKGPGWGALIVASLCSAAAAIGVSFAVAGTSSSAPVLESSPSTSQSAGNVPSLAGGIPDWEAVAEAVRPATVSISAISGDSGGTGSGVIIDTSGVIVTNNHVVANVTGGGQLTVTLSDGRVYDAELVGTDPTTDLAVIKIPGETEGLVAASFAASSDLKVGQSVMAIGAPLGLSDTVTTGVISALERPVVVSGSSETDERVITNAIQIDAAINQGNSGGPLFDQTGAVIGINSSIASLSNSSETAGSIGLGFAIPSDLVKNVTDQILTTGQVKHALLGVTLSSGVVKTGESGRVGAVINEVVPGGAAEQAGLLTGDVIVGVDGNTVVSGPSLTGYIRRYSADDQITLDVIRDGEQVTVPVTLQEK